MSFTREAELAMLVAEQEADDTPFVRQRGASLDKAFDESDPGSGTLLDVIGSDFWGEAIGTQRPITTETRPTIRDLFYWKYLHHKHRWTYPRISAHVGVPARSIRHHVGRPYHVDGTCFAVLASRFDVLAHAYERGARLRDIAEDVYAECGYASPGACYVALHVLFTERKVRLRPGRWKHGMRSRNATKAQNAEYYRPINRRRQEGKGIRRCEARTRAGRRCQRWGMEGKCVVHRPNPPRLKWTRAVVGAAFQAWVANYGRLPRPSDWARSENGHPNHTTVYNLFGSWGEALAAAGLRASLPQGERATKETSDVSRSRGRAATMNGLS